MSHGNENGFISSNPELGAAADAVLKMSAPMPEEASAVHGIEFNNYRDRMISVEDLVAGMGAMGFQASAVSSAVQIINGMVC